MNEQVKQPDEVTFGELDTGETFLLRGQRVDNFRDIYIKVSNTEYVEVTGSTGIGFLRDDFPVRRIARSVLRERLTVSRSNENEVAELRNRAERAERRIEEIYSRLEELGFERRERSGEARQAPTVEYQVSVSLSISVPRGESPYEWLDDNYSSPGDLVYCHGRIEER